MPLAFRVAALLARVAGAAAPQHADLVAGVVAHAHDVQRLRQGVVIVGVVAERLAELLDRRGGEEVVVPRGDGKLRAWRRVEDLHQVLLRVPDDAGGVGDRDAAVGAGAVDRLPQRAVEDPARGVPRPPPAPGGPEGSGPANCSRVFRVGRLQKQSRTGRDGHGMGCLCGDVALLHAR
eukprot:gene14863-biopygen13465